MLNAGDFEGFLGLHAVDVVMHVPGDGPLSGDHNGREGVAAVFQKEMSMLDEPPEFSAHDDLGSDEHAGWRSWSRRSATSLEVSGRAIQRPPAR